jgi:hypothetical protein
MENIEMLFLLDSIAAVRKQIMKVHSGEELALPDKRGVLIVKPGNAR